MKRRIPIGNTVHTSSRVWASRRCLSEFPYSPVYQKRYATKERIPKRKNIIWSWNMTIPSAAGERPSWRNTDPQKNI